jgi:hypothetical protein
MSQKTSLFAALHAMTEEIQVQKQAAARSKTAATPDDPGGYQGDTTHPVKDVDNNVQNATEGARSTENAADVKKDQGAPGVDSMSEAKPGESQDQQVQIGTTKSPTGEDPSTEDAYKGTKDDPGTTHPANAEDGEKYSSVSFAAGRSKAAALANDILADLANGFGERLQKQATAPATVAPSAADAAAQAGYELATVLGLQKTAAQKTVEDCLAQTIRDAHTDADLFGGYYTEYCKKAAEAEADDKPRDPTVPVDAGGPPPEAGAGAPPPEAGAGDLGALLGAGGGGGDAGLGGAPAAPAQPSEEEALQELAAALEELGIPPEALAEAAAANPAAGNPEPAPEIPPAGPAVPTPDAGGAGPAEGLKLAAQRVIAFKRSGRYQIKAASTKRARDLRDSMKATIRELLRLS